MINLLDTNTKKELRAARLNVTLRKYVIFFIVVALAISGAFGVGYWLLLQDHARHNESSEAFKVEQAKYRETINQSTAFASNLSIAKAILANEILFSDFTINIAKILPKDSALQNLTVSTEDFKKPIILSVRTTSYDNAVNVKNAFEDSPIFEGVNIISTSTIEKPLDKYTHLVSLNVTISKDAFKELR